MFRSCIGHYGLGEFHTVFQEDRNLTERVCWTNCRSLALWDEKQDLIETDSAILEKLRRMCTDEDLTIGCSLDARKHRRNVSNHFGVKRELGLLEEKGSCPIQRGPQESHETQGSV